VEAFLAEVGNQKGHAPGRMARRRKIRIVGDDEVFGVGKLQIWQTNAGKEGVQIRTGAEQIPGSKSSPWTAAVCGMIFQSISSLGNRYDIPHWVANSGSKPVNAESHRQLADWVG
jgi:hypothetical protein